MSLMRLWIPFMRRQTIPKAAIKTKNLKNQLDFGFDWGGLGLGGVGAGGFGSGGFGSGGVGAGGFGSGGVGAGFGC